MDLLKTKSELEVEKTDTEARLAVLRTKDGADAFLSDTRKALQACIKSAQKHPDKPGHISMTELLELQLKRTEQFPAQVIREELSKLKRNALDCTAQIKAMDKVEKEPVIPVDPIEKERA
jgi:hypothetical protein